MARKAMIIIDMLNDFVDEKGVLYCGESSKAIIPIIREKAAVCREQGGTVIYLQDAHDEADLEFEKFPKHAVAGTWGNRIIETLAPAPGDRVLQKTRYSGFYGTGLDKVLREVAPDEVMVVGVCTSICVMDTVGGLVNRDYNVTIPVDAVADFDAQAHEFALKRMKHIYGARMVAPDVEKEDNH